MFWHKKGQIIKTPSSKRSSWTHAVAPTCLMLTKFLMRVFFCRRDKNSRSSIFSLDLDISKDPWQIVRDPMKPILLPGDPGTFDDSGVIPAWIVVNGAKMLFYYTGWNIGVTVPFRYAVGLALSDDSGISVYKFSDGPIMDRSINDVLLVASPCVLSIDGKWRMWYVSGVRWEQTASGQKHFYHIRTAISNDGINWSDRGRVCIDFENDLEYAFSRPSVIFENNLYRMWYSYRSSIKNINYTIGYAESRDGLEWHRRDYRVGINVSNSGWDSEMICYPYVFRHDGCLFMLYNGNGYGATGFGYAISEG